MLNRSRLRHGHKYYMIYHASANIACLGKVVSVFNKQQVIRIIMKQKIQRFFWKEKKGVQEPKGRGKKYPLF